MTDRTVSVVLQAKVNSFLAGMTAAGRATTDLANKVDLAKGKTAEGFHTIGVTGVAMGGLVAGGFALAVKSAADFESKMALVRTLSHATAGEMDKLHKAALTVGQAYGFSAGEVADAEAELVKAGVSVQDVIGGALTGALTLAAAGQTDVAEATTIAATAMTQFGLAGKDVPHIADLLSAGADKALGSVGDLGYALDQAGPQAHQFGVSLEETVGTLAAFAQAGQVGERGGTVFSQMLLQLSAPSKQASDILKQLGINVYDAAGQFVGMASLAGQLQSKMGGLTQAERTHDMAVIFGARAVRGANILYQEGAKGIKDWTDAVNDQGFAALQAAGKMDSLSGDLTKLKTALQAAFIGAGEGGQGPLRTMTQDLTKAVETWNDLPGPVKTAAEALTLAGGAVTFAGGAALLFIPKWTAMNAALVASGRSAVTARGAFLGLGKLGGAAITLVGVAEGIHAVTNALAGAHNVDVDKLTNSLVTFQETAKVQGQLADTFGPGLKDLGSEIRRITDPGVNKRVQDVLATVFSGGGRVADLHRDLTQAHKDFDALDSSLAGLVTSGHADAAREIYLELAAAAKKQGVSVQDLASLLPGYGQALDNAGTQAKLAGHGVDQFGNKAAGAAKKTKTAADAAKHYSDVLHALADPLFGLNQALQGVTDAQHAANVAVRKYGEDSPQAKQANLDLASAALEAEAAARTLAASVKDGSVSIGDARKFLKAWVADGLLTKKQADDVTTSFNFLIGRAKTISGLHPHLKVTADTSQADNALSDLLVRIGNVVSAALSLGGSGSSGPTTPAPGQHRLGLDGPPPAGSTQPTHHHSSGGSTGTATTGTGGLYTASGSGSGSGSGGSGSKKERPPTVQEIVHAIMTGTIPPSIDKLSHVLQTEIRHLSNTVGNAQQYRSSVRSNLLGYASLSNATAPTDIYGREMGPVRVNSYLKGRYAQLKQFVHLIHRLERDGAGRGLLQEFEEIGPDANPMMRELLSRGRSAVRRASRLEDRVAHLATRAAGEAATDQYGKEMLHELRQLPKADARELVKALRHEHIYIDTQKFARERGRRVRSKS